VRRWGDRLLAARERWNPQPTGQISPDRVETGFDGAPEPADFTVRRELRRLMLDGVSTVVQVARPVAPGRFPALVFCHGAGTGNHTAFDEHCAVLARRGVIAVVADKDLATYSTLRRDYAHMARQYADLADWVRGQDWLAPGRLGYYAESEGAWVAPWAAVNGGQRGIAEIPGGAGQPAVADARPSPERPAGTATGTPDRPGPGAAARGGADFMALVSAPVVTPREQGLYAVGTYLTSVDAPASAFDAGVRLCGADQPWDWFEYLDFDATPYLERLNCPIFMAYGAADISMPVVQGAHWVRQTTGGPVAVRYYADADHGLRRGQDHHVSATFLNDLAAWVLCLALAPGPGASEAGADFAGTAGRAPKPADPADLGVDADMEPDAEPGRAAPAQPLADERDAASAPDLGRPGLAGPGPGVAGSPPVQLFAAVPPAPTGPISRDGYALLGGLAALVVAALAAKRRRGPERGGCQPKRRPKAGLGTRRAHRPGSLACLAAGALATLLAQAGYLGFLFRLAAAYRTAPGAVRWGHRLVQGLGLATVLAGLAAASGAVRAWSGRNRAGAAEPTKPLALLAALTGAGIWLRVAARWGAFRQRAADQAPVD
jgi:hypothetical protein